MTEVYLKRREIDFNEFVKRSALETDYDQLITDDVIAIDYLLSSLEGTDYKLVGVAPTANPLNYHKEFNNKAFIVGDFIAIKPSEPRFDPKVRLKEDYDFTLQHIQQYGGALRCNKILSDFKHRSNQGGAVDDRTVALETAVITYLKDKWGDLIKDNPKRRHEILLKVRQ